MGLTNHRGQTTWLPGPKVALVFGGKGWAVSSLARLKRILEQRWFVISKYPHCESLRGRQERMTMPVWWTVAVGRVCSHGGFLLPLPLLVAPSRRSRFICWYLCGFFSRPGRRQDGRWLIDTRRQSIHTIFLSLDKQVREMFHTCLTAWTVSPVFLRSVKIRKCQHIWTKRRNQHHSFNDQFSWIWTWRSKWHFLNCPPLKHRRGFQLVLLILFLALGQAWADEGKFKIQGTI